MTTPPDIEIAAALITDADGRHLLVRKRGTQAFMQAGGKVEPGENPAVTVVREIAEELGVQVDPAEVRPLGHRYAPAANEPGHRISAHVFAVPVGHALAEARPAAEIAEAVWVDTAQAAVLPLAPLTAGLLGLDPAAPA